CHVLLSPGLNNDDRAYYDSPVDARLPCMWRDHPCLPETGLAILLIINQIRAGSVIALSPVIRRSAGWREKEQGRENCVDRLAHDRAAADRRQYRSRL